MDLVESYAEDLRFARKRFTRALLGLLVVALAVFPLVAPDWMVFLATLVALYSIGYLRRQNCAATPSSISRRT